MKRFLILLLLAACSVANTDTVLAPQDFETKLNATEGAILLDVRTEKEVSTGALEGAVNIVYDKDFANKLTGLEHKPIFIYCAAGVRSAKAAGILRQNGYDVYELNGGIEAWKEAGKPVK